MDITPTYNPSLPHIAGALDTTRESVLKRARECGIALVNGRVPGEDVASLFLRAALIKF